jgi:hypothetical protein
MPDTSAHLLYGLIAFWVIVFSSLIVLQRKISLLEKNIEEIKDLKVK